MHQLCFVEMIINGSVVQARFEVGTLHIFVQTKLAKDLGLKITLSKIEVEAVNSKENKVMGVSSVVHVQLNEWKGHVNFGFSNG
jgi:hypothetical protein